MVGVGGRWKPYFPMLEPYKNDVREMSYQLFQEYLIKKVDIRELKKKRYVLTLMVLFIVLRATQPN